MRLMLRLSLLAIVLGACAAERLPAVDAPVAPPPDAAAAVVEPPACTQTITLAPTSAGMPAQQVIGPLAVDATGIAVCLDLDATSLARAHLMAGTSWEQGTASSFAATLARAADRVTIQDGWDVTVDDTPPRTMTNLEWSPPAGQVTSTILWVRARGTAATTTTIDMGLFDPLE
jgi:hypothetical protein